MPSRDVTFSLASFVGEIGLAWQKLAMYQEGHPARHQAVERAHAVLVGLIAPTGSLSLGIGRGALIGPEERLGSPPAKRLAQALYLREVAVLRFEEGVELWELETLLKVLPRGQTWEGHLPFAEELLRHGVSHVTAEAVDFSGLVATDRLDDTASRRREESLWDRMLQRLLQDQRLSAVLQVSSGPGAGSMDEVLAVVNSLIERYAASRDDLDASGVGLSPAEALQALASVVGRVLGEELGNDSDDESRRSTLRHVTELLGALPESMREGVLDAAVRELAGGERAEEGLRSLHGAISAARLVGSLRRMRAERVAFSPRVVSLVESLSLEASPSLRQEPTGASSSLPLESLRDLLGGGDLDRRGQRMEDRLFIDLRSHVPQHALFADLEPYLATLAEERLQIDLAVSLVDLLERPIFDAEQIDRVIERLQETFQAMLAGERFVTATRLVESLLSVSSSPDKTRPIRGAADRCLECLRDNDTLAVLVDTIGAVPSDKMPAVYRLIRLLGPRAVLRLLGSLAEESDLSRRRHIFDLLAGLGSALVPPAVALLDDGRWYMIRNLLSLLNRVGEGITPKVLTRGLFHHDARVRLEAVKCLGAYEGEVPAEWVERLIGDEDPRVAEAAIVALGNAHVGAAVPALVELLRRRDSGARQKSLRLRALQALGEIGDPEVLPRIEHFFRSWFASVSLEERHLAFESLRLYPPTAQKEWARKGVRAPDARIREICRDLLADDRAGA